MVQAPMASHEDLASLLAGKFKDNASVTEQNDGLVRFDIGGDLAVPLLERLCPANSRAMQSGAIVRAAIEHLGCFVLCHTARRQFSILGPRSSAASLHHALLTAARSVA